MVLHSIIQKEGDVLLAKGAIELLMGGAGFYQKIFVVPKHTGGLYPYSMLCNLTALYIDLHLRCLLSDMYGTLFNKVMMLFY